MIHVPALRGLGTFMVQDGAGNIIDCDSVWNVFNSACWGILGGTGTPVTAVAGGAPAPGSAAAAGGGAQPYAVDCTQLVNQLNPSTNCQNPLMGSLGPLLIGGVVLLVLLKK